MSPSVGSRGSSTIRCPTRIDLAGQTIRRRTAGSWPARRHCVITAYTRASNAPAGALTHPRPIRSGGRMNALPTWSSCSTGCGDEQRFPTRSGDCRFGSQCEGTSASRARRGRVKGQWVGSPAHRESGEIRTESEQRTSDGWSVRRSTAEDTAKRSAIPRCSPKKGDPAGRRTGGVAGAPPERGSSRRPGDAAVELEIAGGLRASRHDHERWSGSMWLYQDPKFTVAA